MPEEELKIVKLQEIAAEKMVEYIPGGVAWKAAMPKFPAADLYSDSSSSAPSAPDMSYRDSQAPPRDPPSESGGEPFYPRLSEVAPYKSVDLPPPVFHPPSDGIGTQTSGHYGTSAPQKSEPTMQPGYRVLADTTPPPASDYDDLMARFSKLKK